MRWKELAVVVPLVVATLSLAAQTITVRTETIEIVGVEVEVTDLATRKTEVHPFGEHVPLTVGDRVRVGLRATGMVGGVGRRVEVPVEYEEAGADWRIAVERSRDAETVVVEAVGHDHDGRGNAQARAQVAFRIGGHYQIKPRLASGRITFNIERAAGGEDDDRIGAAEAVAARLSQILYVEDPEVEAAWVDALQARGAAGIPDLARSLAVRAQNSQAMRDAAPWQVAAHLYQQLLGRSDSAAELWEHDPGFRGAVEMLEDDGYAALVATIVASEEFADQPPVRRLSELGGSVFDTRRTAVPRPR
jgi:hypothetical protein